MQIIIIIVLFIILLYFIDTYLKKIVLLIFFIICGYLLYKFIKWLVFQIRYYKWQKKLYSINSSKNTNFTIKKQEIEDSNEKNIAEYACIINKEQLYDSLIKILKNYTELKQIEDINTNTSKEQLHFNTNRDFSENNLKPQSTYMSEDIERYARECNEYLRKQDMKEQYEKQKKINKKKQDFTRINSTLKGINVINTDYDTMEGLAFEYFCADILNQNGFVNVEVTQGSGDHGIDVLAEKDDITYAIQCKCYSDNVGNAAVQQAHTGKSLYHKDIAVVMTNRYFTAQAIEEAKELGVKLWDRDKLNGMIEVKND